MHRLYKIVLVFLALSLLPLAIPTPTSTFASDCDGTSVGFVPLNDLGTGTYLGSQGGLYPDGSNHMPVTHAEAGVAIAEAIQPLNNAGETDEENGRIVLISIGMSNASQEFVAFTRLAQDDPLREDSVEIVNGAQGGKTAQRIIDPADDFWTVLDERLAAAELTPQQVLVVWLKEIRTNVAEDEHFPTDAQILQDQLSQIIRIAKTRFPNLKIAYLSSRIYAGYASSNLSPEPYAYQSGFAVKWLIEDQINGESSLNYDPIQGDVVAPWLAWGPYLWADGETPRSDGLTWLCSDFDDADGTHPSAEGALKVGERLRSFFISDFTAFIWYTGLNESPTPTPSPTSTPTATPTFIPTPSMTPSPAAPNPLFLPLVVNQP